MERIIITTENQIFYVEGDSEVGTYETVKKIDEPFNEAFSKKCDNYIQDIQCEKKHKLVGRYKRYRNSNRFDYGSISFNSSSPNKYALLKTGRNKYGLVINPYEDNCVILKPIYDKISFVKYDLLPFIKVRKEYVKNKSPFPLLNEKWDRMSNINQPVFVVELNGIKGCIDVLGYPCEYNDLYEEFVHCGKVNTVVEKEPYGISLVCENGFVRIFDKEKQLINREYDYLELIKCNDEKSLLIFKYHYGVVFVKDNVAKEIPDIAAEEGMFSDGNTLPIGYIIFASSICNYKLGIASFSGEIILECEYDSIKNIDNSNLYILGRDYKENIYYFHNDRLYPYLKDNEEFINTFVHEKFGQVIIVSADNVWIFRKINGDVIDKFENVPKGIGYPITNTYNGKTIQCLYIERWGVASDEEIYTTIDKKGNVVEKKIKRNVRNDIPKEQYDDPLDAFDGDEDAYNDWRL